MIRTMLLLVLTCTIALGAFALDLGPCILFDASYGERMPGSTGAVALWSASSGWKVSQDRPTPGKTGKRLEIRAARNETEATQLVVNPSKALSGFIAEGSALAGPEGAVISAENVEVLRVRYVNVTRPTDRFGAVGMWPDPLPPFKGTIDLAAGKNQPLWVRVSVPRDAAPGKYEGVVRLKADGYAASVPLRVVVYDFDLPDRMTCTSAFGFSPGNVYRYHGLSDPAQRELVLNKYLKNIADHHITNYNPVPGHGIKVEWQKIGADEGADLPAADRKLLQEKTLTPVFDWADWDAAIEKAIKERFITTFRIGIPGMGGGTYKGHSQPKMLGYTLKDPEFHLAFNAYAKAVEAHLEEKGWLDMAYVYWFDEPFPRQYEFVTTQFQRLRDAAPKLRGMLTEEVQPELAGGPKIWCPLTGTYFHEDTLERRAAGDIFWSYICTGPKAPFGGLFTDHPGTDFRVWLWQCWKYDFEGILIWASNLWTTSPAYSNPPQNPYEDPMSWVSGRGMLPDEPKEPWGNGDGRFMYPPEAAAGVAKEPVLDGPVDSMRWEMLRDGIEDYEYMAILERLIESKRDSLSSRKLKRFEKLLTVPEEIAETLKIYTKDPAPVEKQRDKVARAIEKLAAM